jgi:hypothetical protein
MNQSATNITFSPNSYEHVGRRIQKMVSDPKVQKHEAWERVLQELDETEGITVERLDQDCVHIGWKSYIDC